MSVEATKETLCINQIIGKKVDTAIIEEDFVVPDIKPDILNAINTSGVVCIYKKEVMDGKIRMDGCVNTYIMYLADDGESAVRSLNVNLDFSHIVDFSNLKIGMMVETNVAIKTIECRVINGRKINVRAILEIELNAYSNEDLEFVQQIGDIKDVQLLKENLSINSLLGTGNTKVYAKDTIMIDSVDDLAEIMKVNLDIRNREIKVSYNKILVKADCVVKIMYLTGDNRICTKMASIPVMGFVDIANVTDENICNIKNELKNLVIKPNNVEEHSIFIENEFSITCSAFESKEINIIQDLYSPEEEIKMSQELVTLIQDKNIIRDVCNVQEKIDVSEINSNKIYNIKACPNIVKENQLNNSVSYEGELVLKILYESNITNRIEVKEQTVSFTHTVTSEKISKNSNISTDIEIESKDFICMPDNTVDIKLNMNFILNIYQKSDVNIVNNITVEEYNNNNSNSLVIYFVKDGDTLWKIAKKFKSTMEEIATVNNIENIEKINVGDQLYIPKYVYTRASQ